ncbi:MAG: hypothetical protein ACT4PS_02380 [Betaproteobacteria bacterium]
MNALAALEARLAAEEFERDAIASARALLAIAEETLEQWVVARGDVPTGDRREGFRLLALHRQGARGVPSFNACRETCREIAYHYNLLMMAPQHEEFARRARMMRLLVKHLVLFVGGKMEVEGLGEFCCASRPLRTESSI